ncbi:MAG: HEAT repeat domain-containing protein [Cyanobium sp.]
MNPSLLGAVSATLLVVLWLATRRRPRPFLRSADTSAVAALNRAQIAWVRPAEEPGEEGELDADAAASAALGGMEPTSAGVAGAGLRLPAPGDARGRRRLLQRLAAAAAADPAERLEAMRIARRWGDRAVLPLLRRGLRDVHPAVVEQAALAMAAYRGRPAQPSSARPRRVSRTR